VLLHHFMNVALVMDRWYEEHPADAFSFHWPLLFRRNHAIIKARKNPHVPESTVRHQKLTNACQTPTTVDTGPACSPFFWFSLLKQLVTHVLLVSSTWWKHAQYCLLSYCCHPVFMQRLCGCMASADTRRPTYEMYLNCNFNYFGHIHWHRSLNAA